MMQTDSSLVYLTNINGITYFYVQLPQYSLAISQQEESGPKCCCCRVDSVDAVDQWPVLFTCVDVCSQMEYERQIASVRAQNALEGDFSISQAELSSRQAMLENASDIKVYPSEISLLLFIYFSNKLPLRIIHVIKMCFYIL